MEDIHWVLLFLVTGFLLLGFGFNYRDKDWGIGLMSLGVVSVLMTVLFKLYIVFN
jgi:vacuolar-type H+-ATPase subunit I/STV1